MSTLKRALADARQSETYWIGRVKFNVAAQLQDLLKRSNFNQERFAERLGVKPPQVSRALSGGNNATLESLVKMGWALGYVPSVTFVPIQAKLNGTEGLADQAEISLDLSITEVSLGGGHFRAPVAPRPHLDRRYVPTKEQIEELELAA